MLQPVAYDESCAVGDCALGSLVADAMCAWASDVESDVPVSSLAVVRVLVEALVEQRDQIRLEAQAVEVEWQVVLVVAEGLLQLDGHLCARAMM